MTSVKKYQNEIHVLISRDIPEFPWQTVATDIFTYDGHDYLLIHVVDYYSNYIDFGEIALYKSSCYQIVTAINGLHAMVSLKD